MTIAHEAAAPTTTAGTVRMLRVFLIRVLIAAAVYAWLVHGSKSGAVGPEPDAARVSFAIGPNPIMLVVFAAIAIGGFRAAERGDPELAALLRRRLRLIIALVALSFVVAMCWLSFYPLEGWPQPNTWFFPFPFAAVEMVGPS